MEFECVCGSIILFPSPERQGGFIYSEATCPECGRRWIARIMQKV